MSGDFGSANPLPPAPRDPSRELEGCSLVEGGLHVVAVTVSYVALRLLLLLCFQSYTCAHMCMTSLHALSVRLPFLYGWQFPAHHIYITVVASPCTSPRATHRRTSTQHKVSAAVGALAPGFPSSCSGHAISACACHDHAYATSSAVDLLPSTCICCTWLYYCRLCRFPFVG